jgi:hypothetical protein
MWNVNGVLMQLEPILSFNTDISSKGDDFASILFFGGGFCIDRGMQLLPKSNAINIFVGQKYRRGWYSISEVETPINNTSYLADGLRFGHSKEYHIKFDFFNTFEVGAFNRNDYILERYKFWEETLNCMLRTSLASIVLGLSFIGDIAFEGLADTTNDKYLLYLYRFGKLLIGVASAAMSYGIDYM